MGKLKDLATVKSTNAASFAYLPPDSAFDAMRILVKPQLRNGAPPPASISMDVLGGVLRGLRRASPLGRIVIMEGIAPDLDARKIFHERGITGMLDAEMRLTDADNLIMHDYPNTCQTPARYESLTASEYIKDYDCVISVAAFDPVGATLTNLRGFFPQEQYHADFAATNTSDLLSDLYFIIGHHIDGTVVDLTNYTDADGTTHNVDKVIWGDNLLAVDEVACQMANQPVPQTINHIRQLRKQERSS